MPEVETIQVTQKSGGLSYNIPHHVFTTDFEFNHHTYMIPKGKNFNRYQQYPILDSNGNVQATMESEFETELRNKSRK